MLEVAGLIVSGISLIKDLLVLHEDLESWDQQDLEVDGEWLRLATEKELLPGSVEDYVWSALRHVSTRELKGTHQTAQAHNDDKKILYRIVQGPPDDRSVLMKKIASGNK